MMEGGKSTRLLLGVLLISLGCTLNAAEKGKQESSRQTADDRNSDNAQVEPLKRQLMNFTAFRDKQRLTMPRLQGVTRRLAETTSGPSNFGRHDSWGDLSAYLARLPTRLFAVDRLPGHW